jgi:hypothetical protein
MRYLVLLSALIALPVTAASPIASGQWEYRSTVLSMEMPGAPPGMAERMKRKPIVTTQCITPAEAAQGPRGLMAKGNGSCRYTRFVMAGGRLEAVMQCGVGKNVMTMAMQGRYTPISYSTAGQMSTTNGMKMSVVGSGRRIGPCK